MSTANSSLKDELIRQYHDFRSMDENHLPDEACSSLGRLLNWDKPMAELRGWLRSTIRLAKAVDAEQFFRFMTGMDAGGAIPLSDAELATVQGGAPQLSGFLKSSLDNLAPIGRFVYR